MKPTTPDWTSRLERFLAAHTGGAARIVRIHALALPPDLEFLPRPRPDQSPARAALEAMARQLQRLGEPHPALELAIRWLRPRLPACATPTFVHGDFRIGNLMVGPNGLV